MKVGKDSVVIGNVPPDTQVGDYSVVIGATDARGNTILNASMAVGRGAHAGPGSIAIGAHANAGSAQIAELQNNLDLFAKFLATQHNEVLVQEFEKFKAALQQSPPDKNLILKSWDGVRSLATIDGAHAFLTKITASLFELLGDSA